MPKPPPLIAVLFSVYVSAALVIFPHEYAWSQTDTPPEVSMCQAAMQQLYLWCRKQQSGAMAGYNCEKARLDVNSYCYHENLPKLSCAAAQKESELWCGGNAIEIPGYTSFHCSETQIRVRSFCFGGR